MVNPRQRRKNRSSVPRAKQSRRQNDRLRKVVVKGPEVIVKNWDKRRTMRQNYAKMGLLSHLGPRQVGGIELSEPVPFALRSEHPTSDQPRVSDDEDLEGEDEEEEEEEDEDEEFTEPIASTSTSTSTSSGLSKGQGRIIRDSEGKVIKVIIAGEEEGDDDDGKGKARGDEEGMTPWGKPFEDWSEEWKGVEGGDGDGDEVDGKAVGGDHQPEGKGKAKVEGQGIPYRVKKVKVVPKTDTVRELESISTQTLPSIRHPASGELVYLSTLLTRHGEDYGSMARDMKLNVWQRTEGELRRAIRKAGGVEGVRKAVSGLAMGVSTS